MLPLKLRNRAVGLKILCLGAHCDDIEIGCGGTLLKLLDSNPTAEIKWVVFTSSPERLLEAERSAEQILHRLKQKDIAVMGFKDGFLPYDSMEMKKYFEQLKDFQPDIIFTHYRHDRHQDHRAVSDLTWNTFRNHLILEYEIPKYDGDLRDPNFFVLLEDELAKNKVQHILDHFPSQASKHWFDGETFYSLMRIRGMECGSANKYAEAFYVRKCNLFFNEDDF
jgi:LmbE family N-acetylglucosaminyl deacetylase